MAFYKNWRGVSLVVVLAVLIVALTLGVVVQCNRAGQNSASAPQSTSGPPLSLTASAAASPSDSPTAATSTAPSPGSAVPVFGLDYGPYTIGDGPGAHVPDERIEAQLKLLQGKALWIKPPGVTQGNSNVPQIAHRLGFKVFASAYITKDPTLTAAEIGRLEFDIDHGWVDMAAVGNEAVWQNYRTVPELGAELDKVRSYIHGRVPLTTIEPDLVWMKSPELANHVDVVTANITPFSLERPYQQAMAYVAKSYADVGKATHKEVWIGETEWSTDGGYHGNALASPQNASKYFREVEQWARKNQVKLFYFEAFDEPWLKIEGPVGPHWGVFTSDGKLKSGMERGFQNP